MFKFNAVHGFALAGLIGGGLACIPAPTPAPELVTQYSGGKVVGSWTSKGQVNAYSTGCNFTDASTGKQITIHGDYSVESISTDNRTDNVYKFRGEFSRCNHTPSTTK